MAKTVAIKNNSNNTITVANDNIVLGGQSVVYTDNSGTIDYNSFDYVHTFGPFTFHSNRVDICTCCKKEKPIAISYTPFKDTRYICNDCSQDAFDKMFGISNSSEKVLYGK